MEFIISSSADNNIPAGMYQSCKFEGIEQFTSKSGDDLLRWKWTMPDKRTISAITGCDKATTKNRLGRFLCQLANRPISEGKVDPQQYIGKMYGIIVEANDKGSQVANFSLMA